ncbi:MAG TPA: HutD family protein [Pseudomonadales bacterium]|nr:HutD family protein [Pseudomonadales bacterium]
MSEFVAASACRVAIARLPSEPWRNGYGTTRTVATGGAAESNGWDWRVSVADIASDGPFSIFPGVDRHLALVEGRGVVLYGDARTARVTRIGQVATFAGEESLHARLLDGPVRVWNLMVTRAAAVGRVYEHPHSATHLSHPNGLVRFLTVVAGRYRVCGPALGEMRLSAGEALRLDASLCDVQLRAVDDYALALISDIQARDGRT